MAYPALLAEDDIAARLRQVPAWRREGPTIVRDLEFFTFPAAIAFVDDVARLAESRDHHPEILIRWRRVRLTLTTHARHGLTTRDFELASLIDSHAGRSKEA